MSREDIGTTAKDAQVLEVTEVKTKKKRAPRSVALVKNEVSVVAGVSISTEELRKSLDAQTEQRKVIADFIKKHLKPGVDYIRIHVVKNCQAEDNRRGSCKYAGHFSKDVLAKPGQEKIFSLFQLNSTLERDNETMEMLAGTKNLVAYKCIVSRRDQVVAEGRGAAIVGDNRRDVNATIKIAEKRARMDACLALGFSEYFAQDLDDPDYQTQRKAAEEQAAGRADDGTGLAPRPANAPIDDQERTVIARHLLKAGFDTKEEQLEFLAVNGITEPNKMTSGMARVMIKKMRTNVFTKPAKQEPKIRQEVSDGVDEAVEQFKAEQAKMNELNQEPELEVDDDFKAEVESRAKEVGLNARGDIWLMRLIAGKPFAKWEKLTDTEWRRAYDVIMGILDGDVEVEDKYFQGVITSKNATVEPKDNGLAEETEDEITEEDQDNA